jgi:hypothetical protein
MAKIVCPLLTGLAIDHSKRAGEGLVGEKIAPVIMVDEEKGAYQEFGKEAGKVPETALAANGGKARTVSTNYDEKEYSCKDHALNEYIDKKKLVFTDGPFSVYERNAATRLTTQLQISKEIRIRDKIKELPGERKLVLSAAAAEDKYKLWINGNGDPVTVIEEGLDSCAIRPNTIVIPESIFNTLKHHPKIIAHLGEMNMIKKLTVERMAELFDIANVLIAKGKSADPKKKSGSLMTMGQIWQNMVILAYVSDAADEPCACKTFTLKQRSASNQEFIVRKWFDETAGMEGAQVVQVGHSIQEQVLYPEMMRVITW